jgi:hypothetical protein
MKPDLSCPGLFKEFSVDGSVFVFGGVLVLCLSCGAGDGGGAAAGENFSQDALNAGYQEPGSAGSAGSGRGGVFPGGTDIEAALDELAGTERSFGFRPGMALAESALREEGGDYSGAVIAAYKELAYAYSLGVLDWERVREGLDALMVRYGGGDSSLDAENSAELIRAARAVLAFFNGQWKEAAQGFAPLCGDDEPDSFGRWLFLASVLESRFGEEKTGDEGKRRSVLAGYYSIRARYEGFPEYWYHLAPVSGEAAERCVDLAPQGPYARRCRELLARHFGLDSRGAAEALRTRREIENLVSAALSAGDPGPLEELFPLLSLGDNPFTLYALGALNALNSVPAFSDFFAARGRESGGRLAERLRYIAGVSL